MLPYMFLVLYVSLLPRNFPSLLRFEPLCLATGTPASLYLRIRLCASLLGKLTVLISGSF